MSNVAINEIILADTISAFQRRWPSPTLSVSEGCESLSLEGAGRTPYGGISDPTSAKYSQGAMKFSHRGTFVSK